MATAYGSAHHYACDIDDDCWDDWDDWNRCSWFVLMGTTSYSTEAVAKVKPHARLFETYLELHGFEPIGHDDLLYDDPRYSREALVDHAESFIRLCAIEGVTPADFAIMWMYTPS